MRWPRRRHKPDLSSAELVSQALAATFDRLAHPSEEQQKFEKLRDELAARYGVDLSHAVSIAMEFFGSKEIHWYWTIGFDDGTERKYSL